MIRMRLLLMAFVVVFGPISIWFRHHETARGAQPAAPAAKSEPAANAANEPFGIDQRVPWTTSRFRGTPDPPLPYRAVRVFPKLQFKNPTVLTHAPATDRLFVAEQSGKIFSIPNKPDTAAADLFL